MRKLGLFIGAVGGTLFGLLFAPESGKKLRTDLKKTKDPKKVAQIVGNAFMETGKMAADEIAELAKDPRIQKKISELEKLVKQKSKEIRKTIDKEVKGVKKSASKGVNSVKRTAKKKVKRAVSKGKKAVKKALKK